MKYFHCLISDTICSLRQGKYVAHGTASSGGLFSCLLSFQVPWCAVWYVPTGFTNMTERLPAYDLCHSGVEAGGQMGCPKAFQMVQGTFTESSCWCLSCWKYFHKGELSESRKLCSKLHNAHSKSLSGTLLSCNL